MMTVMKVVYAIHVFTHKQLFCIIFSDMEHTVLTIHPIQVMTDSKTATIITILQVYYPIKLDPISRIFTSVCTEKLQSINCGKRFPNGRFIIGLDPCPQARSLIQDP